MLCVITRVAAIRLASSLFAFSCDAAHRARDIVLSCDCVSATAAQMQGGRWVRSRRGVGAGRGLVRWAVLLGKDCGGQAFRLGVASEAFNAYSQVNFPEHSWYFRNECAVADGEQQGGSFSTPCFDAGDVVTFELQRRAGVDCVLRVRVAGKPPREISGLPKDGMLYPIVCVTNDRQRLAMVPLP